MESYTISSGTTLRITGYTQPNKSLPAVDGTGQYFAGAGTGANSLLYYDYTGSGYYNIGVSSVITSPYASAVDSNGYSWTTSFGATTGSASLLKIKFTTAYNVYDFATCTGTNYTSGSGVAIDRGNNVWVSDQANSYLVQFANTCAYTTSYNNGGISGDAPVGVAIDGNNNVWTVTQGHRRVIGLTNAGAALTGTNGYATSSTGTVTGPVIDGSGNIWIANPTANTVSEMLGVAVPVITPLSQGVLQQEIATKP